MIIDNWMHLITTNWIDIEMTLKKVNTLIIDLDNTIFDWFAFWYASFNPIYERIKEISEKDTSEVEEDIRKFHRKHGTSEYSFLIEKLEVLNNIDKEGDRRKQFKTALRASQKGRDENLQLYESVFKSLWDIKKREQKLLHILNPWHFIVHID